MRDEPKIGGDKDNGVIRQISEISGNISMDQERSSQTSIYNASGRNIEELDNFKIDSVIANRQSIVQLGEIKEEEKEPTAEKNDSNSK